MNLIKKIFNLHSSSTKNKYPVYVESYYQNKSRFIRDIKEKKVLKTMLRRFGLNKQGATSTERIKTERIKEDEYKFQKWGVSYSVFDGEELLEASITSIRPAVDYINVVYQNISWLGYPHFQDILPMLEELKDKGLIDEIIEFIPNVNKEAIINEINKRNIGLEYVKKAGCNYFLTSDCDEFYHANEVEETKKDIFKNDITHSFCPMVNYGKTPNQRDISSIGIISFFAKISKNSELVFTKPYEQIAGIDHTRGMNIGKKSKQFIYTSLAMHHMSLIKKDLGAKFKNSSSRIMREWKANDIEEIFKDVIYIEVEDVFNIKNIW